MKETNISGIAVTGVFAGVERMSYEPKTGGPISPRRSAFIE